VKRACRKKRESPQGLGSIKPVILTGQGLILGKYRFSFRAVIYSFLAKPCMGWADFAAEVNILKFRSTLAACSSNLTCEHWLINSEGASTPRTRRKACLG